jgi:hypothetical protein
LLDCHRKTSLNHITSLTKGRIIFGDFKKNLILVDDLHKKHVLFCEFYERGYCANSSILGKLNEDIYLSLYLSLFGKEAKKIIAVFGDFMKNYPFINGKIWLGEL